MVISQKGKPIAFHNRKLTYDQKRYTITEEELLSIDEDIKEFRTILLGQVLRIYTDHKSLSCKNFNTDRVVIWILILEEHGTDIEYIQGQKNILADALSILCKNVNQDTTQDSTYKK